MTNITPDVYFRLLGLADVISALGGPRKGAAIPYRASKLTRYLQVSVMYRFVRLTVSMPWENPGGLLLSSGQQ